MNSFYRALQSSVIVFLLVAAPRAYPQQRDPLNSAERNRLRDAQDPSERIKVYLSIGQTRLNRIDGLQDISPQAEEAVGGQAGELLQQYISIDNELKDWIQYQFDHNGDMRSGLRQLLSEGSRQLQQLQHFRSYAGVRKDSGSLRDAIANLNDTIDGATAALASQEKKFPAMKRDAKAGARALKKARKAEAKRNKEEEKLNKQEEKKLRQHSRKKDDAGDFGEN
ncbi:MAG TPA: hypothetical protein VMW54_08185 [Terriglobia bacterium]|nr:hypothetical protein [Terriglobia bacterium]